MDSFSRRKFIKTTAMGSAAIAGHWQAGKIFNAVIPPQNELLLVAGKLATTWGNALLQLQVKDQRSADYGTMIYPPENKIHGRMGDSFYPFLYLAKQSKDNRYLDAAILLYQWMERTVSQEDGSWLNEPVKNSWKGTTVFTSIALAEAIKLHGGLLDPAFSNQILARLRKSGDYIFNNFSIDYGNINYPVAASYCLSLLGELLDLPAYRQRGKELAHAALKFFTRNHFLHGEGTPYYIPSPKGSYSVDLGYNVEESLPSLVLYSKLTDDTEVLEAVVNSMNTHLEFMLPDGGWDNSWGTRNYKWTWWGSRTSDGSQPAYALMADKNPAFYKAALQNTRLLQVCTRNGILYGGPHYASHQVTPSLHHTFCHLKALVTILDHGVKAGSINPDKIKLPRELAYGSRHFSDIQTTLVANGKYRATITAYDRNYKDFRGGHASGGALSLLWHENAGLLVAASMNEYQLYEASNMQQDTDPYSMPLTPRIEMKQGNTVYMNINDFTAEIKETKQTQGVIVQTRSKLVDKDQQSPAGGEIICHIDYHFKETELIIYFRHDNADLAKSVHIIFPLISDSTEKIKMELQSVSLSRQGHEIEFSSDKGILLLPTGNSGRIFNFVPGLEALPLLITDKEATVKIKVSRI